MKVITEQLKAQREKQKSIFSCPTSVLRITAITMASIHQVIWTRWPVVRAWANDRT
jgi:hypothetical protein